MTPLAIVAPVQAACEVIVRPGGKPLPETDTPRHHPAGLFLKTRISVW